MNAQLIEALGQAIGGGDAIGALSGRLGVPSDRAAGAVEQALPMILSMLGRNAQKPGGLEALTGALNRDHDGSVLDDLAGFLGSDQAGTQGQAILGHVFGQRQPTAAAALARNSGLDVGQAGQLLAMLAPVVMGALGKETGGQRPAESSEVQSLLSGALGMIGGGNQGGGAASMVGTVLGMLGGAAGGQASGRSSGLDSDGDGDVDFDDLMRHGTGLLGGYLSSRR